MPDTKQEPEESSLEQEQPEQELEEGRLSWAAYFGAVTGLIVGLVAAMLLSAALHHVDPSGSWAHKAWSISSPLLALLGVLGLGFFFHAHLQGQRVWPVVFFLLALFLACGLASGPLGFIWKG
jgi:membrane associated rhomboid family serine protease